jgi:nucleoside phosphorylase
MGFLLYRKQIRGLLVKVFNMDVIIVSGEGGAVDSDTVPQD